MSLQQDQFASEVLYDPRNAAYPGIRSGYMNKIIRSSSSRRLAGVKVVFASTAEFLA